MTSVSHYVRSKTTLPERFGHRCRIVAKIKPRRLVIEFIDGERVELPARDVQPILPWKCPVPRCNATFASSTKLFVHLCDDHDAPPIFASIEARKMMGLATPEPLGKVGRDIDLPREHRELGPR